MSDAESQLLAPEGLSMICRLFCEGLRGSNEWEFLIFSPGGAKDSTIKFVEVKGPGDGLSENQKVCILSSSSLSSY